MLLKPDKELARRLMTEVGFDDRIKGYRLGKRTGALSITMYSFQEVAGFLSDTYPSIDLAGLEKWIDTVMGDHELAQKIGAVIQEEQSDMDKMIKTRDLVVCRLVQCKKIV